MALAPLPIVSLGANGNTDPDQIQVHEDNLDRVVEALSKSGAEYVSIMACMGAYRTGKSFLLSFLLRYLQQRETAGDTAKQPPPSDWTYRSKEPIASPSWLSNVSYVPQAEKKEAATSASEHEHKQYKRGLAQLSGFEWRGGDETCTHGIWLFPKPFIFEAENGSKAALLIMDTQGAWDGTMSHFQASTVFGLTTLLSSKLIYNLMQRINDVDIDHLDIFTTIAGRAQQSLRDPSSVKKFGHLEVLIRDYPNFRKGWTFTQCTEALAELLKTKLDPESVKGGDAAMQRAGRVNRIFSSMGCSAFCNPGEDVSEQGYDGDLSVIKKDFMHLLDEFVYKIFHVGGAGGCLKPSRPTGKDLLVTQFKDTVIQLASAFKNNHGIEIGIRDLMVTNEVRFFQEDVIRDLKTKLYVEPLLKEAVMEDSEFEDLLGQLADPFVRKFESRLDLYEFGQEVKARHLERLTGAIETEKENRTNVHKENCRTIEKMESSLIESFKAELARKCKNVVDLPALETLLAKIKPQRMSEYESVLNRYTMKQTMLTQKMEAFAKKLEEEIDHKKVEVQARVQDGPALLAVTGGSAALGSLLAMYHPYVLAATAVVGGILHMNKAYQAEQEEEMNEHDAELTLPQAVARVPVRMVRDWVPKVQLLWKTVRDFNYRKAFHHGTGAVKAAGRLASASSNAAGSSQVGM